MVVIDCSWIAQLIGRYTDVTEYADSSAAMILKQDQLLEQSPAAYTVLQNTYLMNNYQEYNSLIHNIDMSFVMSLVDKAYQRYFTPIYAKNAFNTSRFDEVNRNTNLTSVNSNLYITYTSAHNSNVEVNKNTTTNIQNRSSLLMDSANIIHAAKNESNINNDYESQQILKNDAVKNSISSTMNNYDNSSRHSVNSTVDANLEAVNIQLAKYFKRVENKFSSVKIDLSKHSIEAYNTTQLQAMVLNHSILETENKYHIIENLYSSKTVHRITNEYPQYTNEQILTQKNNLHVLDSVKNEMHRQISNVTSNKEDRYYQSRNISYFSGDFYSTVKNLQVKQLEKGHILNNQSKHLQQNIHENISIINHDKQTNKLENKSLAFNDIKYTYHDSDKISSNMEIQNHLAKRAPFSQVYLNSLITNIHEQSRSNNATNDFLQRYEQTWNNMQAAINAFQMQLYSSILNKASYAYNLALNSASNKPNYITSEVNFNYLKSTSLQQNDISNIDNIQFREINSTSTKHFSIDSTKYLHKAEEKSELYNSILSQYRTDETHNNIQQSLKQKYDYNFRGEKATTSANYINNLSSTSFVNPQNNFQNSTNQISSQTHVNNKSQGILNSTTFTSSNMLKIHQSNKAVNQNNSKSIVENKQHNVSQSTNQSNSLHISENRQQNSLNQSIIQNTQSINEHTINQSSSMVVDRHTAVERGVFTEKTHMITPQTQTSGSTVTNSDTYFANQLQNKYESIPKSLSQNITHNTESVKSYNRNSTTNSVSQSSIVQNYISQGNIMHTTSGDIYDKIHQNYEFVGSSPVQPSRVVYKAEPTTAAQQQNTSSQPNDIEFINNKTVKNEIETHHTVKKAINIPGQGGLAGSTVKKNVQQTVIDSAEVAKIADKIYDNIERRLRSEKARKGLF